MPMTAECKLEINGLKLRTIKTMVTVNQTIKITDYNCLQEIVSNSFGGEGFVIAYLDYKVLVGKFKNGRLIFYQDEIFELKYLQKLRVFDEDRELFIWKSDGGSFNSRLRVDGGGEEKEIVEAHQVLWGTRKDEKVTNGWGRISERGMELTLPIATFTVDTEKNRVKIKTYNYISYNEIGQAGYVDSRFVDFLKGE